MSELPQQAVDVVTEAAGTLSSTQAGALIILLLFTNALTVWALVRCYRSKSHMNTGPGL